MRKRPLGRTGLEVSELTLGTWGLSGDGYGFVSDAEADRVIDRAVALGITLFETADCYGRGDLERKLGKRLPIGRTFVVTKVGTSLEGYAEKRFDADYLVGALERSQERLRRDALDVVLLHNPTMATFQLDATFELLERLRGEARIRAWGVSACSPLVAERALARGAQVLEMAYNAFFFRDVRELGPRLREVGAGLLARSVLSYGLLAGGFTKEREFYPPDHRAERWNPEDLSRRLEQLDALRAVVGGPVPTVRAVAVRFALANDDVSSAVLGPRNVQQLDQLVREAGRAPPYLTTGSMATLEAELVRHGVTGD